MFVIWGHDISSEIWEVKIATGNGENEGGKEGRETLSLENLVVKFLALI